MYLKPHDGAGSLERFTVHNSSVRETSADAACEAHDELVRLMAHYERPLYNYLLVLSGSRDIALDQTQETFLRAFEHLRRDRPINAGWLYKVARNQALNDLKRRKRIAAQIDMAEVMAAESDTGVTFSVHLALARLSTEDREVLYLCDVDGFDAAQIGQMLGIRAGAVRMRILRARRRFREIYGDRGGE